MRRIGVKPGCFARPERRLGEKMGLHRKVSTRRLGIWRGHMRNSLVSVILVAALAVTMPALSQTAVPRLAENAPDRYIVVPGDTLWGIAARFLRDPYRWPDVWEPNKDTIRNPHRIYPGDVVLLDRSGGSPKLRLATVKVSPRVRVEQTSAAIPTIPSNLIEPYLSQPLFVAEGGLNDAPKIIATQEGRVYLGKGDLAYVSGAVDDKVESWQVYRPGIALVDPTSKETLGFEAIFLGTVRLERKTDPTTMRIIESRQEIGAGDRLVPAPKPELVDYTPRAPRAAIDARVISTYGAGREVGGQRVISVSKGKVDGVERGHVLALHSFGAEVRDRSNIFDRSLTTFKLPDERNGLLYIFRVFDRVSYGLVMNQNRPVKLGDLAMTP